MPTKTKPSKPAYDVKALKKRYDQLAAQHAANMESVASVGRKLGKYSPELQAIRPLLIFEGVLPREKTPGQIYHELERQNKELTAEVTDLRKKQTERNHQIERLELIKRVANSGDGELDLIKAALDCIEGDLGCTRPAEEFVSRLLLECVHVGLTPQNAEYRLKEFRENYADMARDAKRFIEANPRVADSLASA